jgi:hypothetical protein
MLEGLFSLREDGLSVGSVVDVQVSGSAHF